MKVNIASRISKELIKQEMIESEFTEIPDLFVFKSIASTNEWLLDNLEIADSKNMLCVAEKQTSGRGRSGREWKSPESSNIYMSFSLSVGVKRCDISAFSLVIGLALIKALKTKQITELSLKWPNDVLLHGRKLAGVLIESKTVKSRLFLVVGLGVNVRMPPETVVDSSLGWADLSATDVTIEHRNEMISLIYKECMLAAATFFEKGFTVFKKEWMQYDEFSGKKITVVDQGKIILKGVNTGIDDNGCLLVRVGSDVKKVFSGDVSLRSKNEK